MHGRCAEDAQTMHSAVSQEDSFTHTQTWFSCTKKVLKLPPLQQLYSALLNPVKDPASNYPSDASICPSKHCLCMHAYSCSAFTRKQERQILQHHLQHQPTQQSLRFAEQGFRVCDLHQSGPSLWLCCCVGRDFQTQRHRKWAKASFATAPAVDSPLWPLHQLQPTSSAYREIANTSCQKSMNPHQAQASLW